MRISFPFHVILIKNLVLFSILAVLLTVFIKIRPILLQPKLWIAIALGSYAVCTSGVVYTMLHSVPVFKFEQNQYGQMIVSEYFMRSSRS